MTRKASIQHPRVREWLQIREPLERLLQPLGQTVIAALAPLPGERVLDVGCGIGGTPRVLAQAVGPDGEVVGIDLLQAAIDVMSADPGLPQTVTLLCGDAQTYPFAPGSFDAVFSRFGVMVFADPVAAFGNLRRALRPQGRLGFVCWRGLADNELDALPLRAAAAHLPGALVEGAAASAWFSFAERETLHRVLTDAGFIDIRITPDDQPVTSGSLPAMVAVCSHVGALGKILRDHPGLRDAAVAALEQALRDLDGPDGPALRAATWVVTARAPAKSG